MFCQKCGKQVSDGSDFCSSCGAGISVNSSSQVSGSGEMRTVPRCSRCGAIGEFKPGPLLRKSDIIWILLLMCLAGSGFIYLIFILIIRSNPDKREKICTKCGSQNTDVYFY